MRDYIIRRLLTLIPILIGVSIAIFIVMQLIPGDVVSGILGIEETPELRAMWEAKLGLDKPLIQQYFSWIGKAVTGDFGESFRTGAPVFPEIMNRFRISAELAILACVIAWIIALPLGIIAGFVLHLNAFWIYICLKSDQIVKAVWCYFRLKSEKWIKKISTGTHEPAK